MAHHHDHEGEENHAPIVIRILLSAVLFACALLIRASKTVTLILYLTVYLLIGYDIWIEALRSIFSGELFDESFLMSLASCGALIIGEFPEGVAVMLLYQIGELLQDVAVDASKEKIGSLSALRPDTAHLINNDQEVDVAPDAVTLGNVILIRPGERIPLDGVILSGASTLDLSALTGESAPVDCQPGDSVLSGSINQSGVLTVSVTKSADESSMQRVLRLMDEASDKKAKTEQFITRFSRIYTPCVVLLAVLLAVLPSLILREPFSEWFHRALSFLVISCPCALVISVPLTFFVGLSAASKAGILIKGGNYLEALEHPDIMIFDKTGTLTNGRLAVSHIVPEPGYDNFLLYYTAACERHAVHPVADALRAICPEAAQADVQDVEELPGFGITALIGGQRVLCGNARLMSKYNIRAAQPDFPGTVVHTAINGLYAGYIIFKDSVKESAPSALSALRKSGVRKLVMLTGDSESSARAISSLIQLDSYAASLLPEQKLAEVDKLYAGKAEGRTLLYVGDGINDAPVLKRADAGIAMGGAGSDSAIESADIVLMDDDLGKLPLAIAIARKTMRIARENILFALIVKLIVLLISALGLAGMWSAVFADVGVSLICIFNALRGARGIAP